ncbi:zinc finger B-box domain-containing protein 1 [Eucyclogobius newberryi]|uniref:zinc finger B-box domain-containing protein 1 n=1 Tax=Eucyclogobius newberryi TaxID=166745 RepID=UPI003B5CC14C
MSPGQVFTWRGLGKRRMFKHKDRRAMNSNANAALPNSTAKSVKLNARNLQGLRKESRSLALESDEMEEKLKMLKEKMSQEKEERAQSGSCKWKSGQQGPINKATTLINPRRTKDNQLQKLLSGKVKIRVLKDEPLTAQPPPPSPATAAPKTLRKSKLKGITCGQCEVRTAGVKCIECSEDYCIGCFSKFHQKGALKYHSTIPLQTVLQTHVSARDVVSSSSLQPPTPNPSCYPDIFSNPNPRPNSTRNHGLLSDAFTDQRPAGAVTAQHALNQNNPSQIFTVHPEENNSLKPETEPSLFNGTYDEEESSKSFQDALRQWRETGPTPAQEPMWIPPPLPVFAVLCKLLQTF